MRLEVFRCRLVAANLHDTKLIPLPFYIVFVRTARKKVRDNLRSRFVDRTKDICTPKLRCTAEQSRHKYMPKGTEDQVGFFEPQSKQT